MKTVLVVDDEPGILRIVERALRNDYNVITVNNPLKVIDILGTNCPHLVLLDVMMPQMNGFTLYSEILRIPRYRRLKVVFLSARNDTASTIRGLDLGAVDYIKKPFDERTLKRRIDALLNLQPQTIVNDTVTSVVQTIQSVVGGIPQLLNEETVGSLCERLTEVRTYADALTTYMGLRLGSDPIRKTTYVLSEVNITCQRHVGMENNLGHKEVQVDHRFWKALSILVDVLNVGRIEWCRADEGVDVTLMHVPYEYTDIPDVFDENATHTDRMLSIAMETLWYLSMEVTGVDVGTRINIRGL